jgi:LuxR family maltose regulon positive regulatory protein
MSLDPARTWFRYHNLFLGLLRLELRRTLPEEVPALHELAARWLAQHGQVTDAIRQLQAAGDWARAARMLGDHSLSLSLDGQAETVRELLRSFPAQMTLDSPELAPVQAIADLDEMRLDAAAGRIEVARSYAATAPPDRQQRLRLQVASLDLLLGRLRGQFDRALERTVTLPAPATDPGSPEAALARDLRALALMNLGVTQAWWLHLRNSERHLADGAALAHEIGRPYLEVACLAYLGFASTAHSVADAQRRSEEALELATRHGWEQQPVIAPALTTLAGMMIWRGEWGAGKQLLDRARLAARTGSEPGIRLLLHMAEGMLHAATGRHREALEMFIAAGHEQSMMAGGSARDARHQGPQAGQAGRNPQREGRDQPFPGRS